jgi:alkylation response protein AidB-like acyl-CoA dehydrogenase
VLEQFARVSNAVAFPVFEAVVGAVRTIERFGSEEMKARVLPPTLVSITSDQSSREVFREGFGALLR